MKLLKALVLSFSLTACLAQAEPALVFDTASVHTLTPLHEQMLSKYGTWTGLRTLCQEGEKDSTTFFKVGFHLVNAADVLSPLTPKTFDFTDPVIFSITQARKNFVEEKARKVATDVALIRPQECQRYDSIEKEAISFFKVKGVLDVAEKTYQNFQKTNSKSR